MRLRRLTTWCMGLIAGVCCVAMLTGCLDTEKTVLIVYDAKTDTFTYLVVYQQIRGVANSLPAFHSTTGPATLPSTTPAAQAMDDGLADLHALEHQRRDLIVLPLPKWILVDYGLMKQPNGRALFCDVTELSAPMDDPETLSKSIDTAAVRIVPGTFFRRGDDNLCYYQAAVLPGSVIDQVIDLINKTDGPSTDWQAAIDARRSAKTPPMSWPEFAKKAADFMEKYDGGDHDDFSGDPQSTPLSVQSLQMLRDQGLRHEFQLRRKGASIYMDVNLTPDDVDGAMEIVGMLRKSAEARLKALADPAVQRTIKNGADGLDCLREELATVDAITLSRTDPHTLRLNFDLIRFCTESTLRPTDPLPPATADEMPGVKFSEKDVPIDRHVTMEQLTADFLSGKLTAAH